MKLICARLITPLLRGAVHAAGVGLCLAMGSGAVAAQPETAQQTNPNASRQELRNVVRQKPGAAPLAPPNERRLTAEERYQLRKQLARELSVQNSAPPTSRP